MISIKRQKIIDTISSIINKENSVIFYKYDFKTKKSTKTIKEITYTKDCKLLILEGIFSHRLNINYKDTINILCKDKKEVCYERRIKRDKSERGREEKEVNKKFNKSWDLYFEEFDKYKKKNNIINIDTFNSTSFKNLIREINDYN